MPLSVKEMDAVLTHHFRPFGAKLIYLAFFIVSFAAIGAVAWNQITTAGSAISSITVVTGLVKPDPKKEEQTTKPIMPIQASAKLGVSLGISKERWISNDDGTQKVSVLAHVSSAFQRSGLLLHFRTNGMTKLEILPVNGQPTVHGKYDGTPTRYSHYIQRPWGIYRLLIHKKNQSDIVFSYRFEGEKESERVTWKAP